jgi:hypothetical protein
MVDPIAEVGLWKQLNDRKRQIEHRVDGHEHAQRGEPRGVHDALGERDAGEEHAQPVEPVALVDPASNARCLPGDLYDLLEETYGKRPSLDRCSAACLPKPASFTEAELDAAAEKSGINWCDNCVQVGGYMPLASVLTLERAANITLCVNPDMCRLPASIGGPASGVEKVTEIRTIFKDLPAGTKNDGNIAVVVGNKDYQGDLPDNPGGSADADAVMALLVDQLEQTPMLGKIDNLVVGNLTAN